MLGKILYLLLDFIRRFVKACKVPSIKRLLGVLSGVLFIAERFLSWLFSKLLQYYGRIKCL